MSSIDLAPPPPLRNPHFGSSLSSIFPLSLQRWRRRWFVLLQQQGPDGGGFGAAADQFVLNYYTDETKKKLKGSIFLDECEQVSEFPI